MLTRFAPSLTGYLHLGHVLHMLHVWGVARATGAKVLCRIEDHDLGRARPEYEAAILENMAWLGFAPDRGITAATAAGPSEFRQSDCSDHYESTLRTLQDRGLVYGCECSRKQIQENQTTPGELRYAGTCAGKGLPLEGVAVRFRAPEGAVEFDDLTLGRQRQTPRNQCGDFSLRDRNGQWTYQFACVCDDIRHGVDLVVRGEDILFSTARQIQLFQTLGAPVPRFLHHPLLRDAAGNKLSKRQRAESLTALKESGATAEEIIGRAAAAGGLIPEPRPISRADALALVAAGFA